MQLPFDDYYTSSHSDDVLHELLKQIERQRILVMSLAIKAKKKDIKENYKSLNNTLISQTKQSISDIQGQLDMSLKGQTSKW